MASKTTNRIAIAEFAEHFEQQTSQADRSYADSLQRLKSIREARKHHQSKQLRRLVQKLGESDPRVVRQAALIAKEHEMVSFLHVAIDRTAVELDAIKGSFTLRGKVRAEDNQGLGGYRVQLKDRKNQVLGQAAKTDRTGAYTLVIDAHEEAELPDARLVVSDHKGIEVHQGALPVSIKADAVAVRDIRVSQIKTTAPGIKDLIQDAVKAIKPAAVKRRVSKKKQTAKKATSKAAKKVSKKTSKSRKKT